MNTIKKSFRPALLIATVCCTLFLNGCGLFDKDKDEKVDPDVASSIAGTYNVTYIKVDGAQAITLPQNGISATFQVNKVNPTTVSIALTLSISGQRETESLGEFTVARQQDGTVVLSERGQQIGTVKNNQLEIDADDTIWRASK